MSSHCWGIFRERAHSPGRESDDTEILRLTGKHLEARGYQVDLKDPEDVSRPHRGAAARDLPDVRARGGAGAARRVGAGRHPHVNSPAAVLATYRERMIAQFEEAGVAVHQEPARRDPGPPSRRPAVPVWVKRGDVHNTQEGDVVFAETGGAVEDALGRFARAGHRARRAPAPRGGRSHQVLRHRSRGRPDGEPPWFRWFYHKDQTLAGHPLDPRQLARLARRAAGALGLEIYGGDAIATADGGLVLLDLNAWPSFALYREEAASAIAAYLALRFDGGAR